MITPALSTLLEDFRRDLLSYLDRKANWLLRFESAEDLWQGLCVRALAASEQFHYEGREPFLAWIHKLARHHLADRRAYWSRLKRGSARVLRITSRGTSTDPLAVLEPPGTVTGPITFADRRERLAFAVKALAVLSPRDRQLVQMDADGMDLKEQADDLEISYEALRQARSRALARFQKAYRLISGNHAE